MANEREMRMCPFCEGYVDHVKLLDGRWHCTHCGREWKEGVDWRKISEKKNETSKN